MLTVKYFFLYIVCFLTSLNATFAQHSPLWINEFMTSNVLAFENTNGDYADWIEIYNSSNTAIDLAGLYFTGDPGTNTYWQIPGGQSSRTTISAKGYLVLFADKMTELGANHLGFKLSSEQGKIVLIGIDGTTILDSFSYGYQFRDISYGRFPDGGGQWMYMPSFTPGAYNKQGFSTFVLPPTIDQEAGFYTNVSVVSVSIQPAAAGDTIRYTLNGSDPGEESPQYTSPIGITQTVIVKARSFRSGSMPSQITTKAFFHADHTLAVLALMTDPKNLYDPVTGIYVNDKDGRGWERFGELEYFKNGSLAFHIPAGLRIQGNTGPVDFGKKSFRAYFRNGYGKDRLVYPLFPGNPVTSFAALVFRSGYDDDIEPKNAYGTLIRDPLVSKLWQRIGGLTPQERFIVLYLNDSYHGIYDLKESIDENYICDHTGYQDVDLIRTRWDSLETIHGDKVEWYDMVDFFRTNSFTSDSKIAEAARFLDLENYTNLQALTHATEYKSWAYGVSAFREKSPNALWRWTIWDADRSYAEINWNGFTEMYSPLADYLDTLITKKLLQNQTYKINFINRMADLLNTTFSPENIKAIIDSLAHSIEAEIPNEVVRWNYSVAKWNANVDSLRTFSERRQSIVRQQIQNYFSLGGQANLTVEISGKGRLVVNTIKIDKFPWSGKYFRGIPITVTAIPDPGFQFLRWEGSSPQAGKNVTLNLSGDTTLSVVFTQSGNANAELIVPQRIKPGQLLPIVVRIRDANGNINPIEQTPITITFGDAHADTVIAIKRGAGTGIVQINAASPFQVSVQNINVPPVQKQIAISSVPTVSYSGTLTASEQVWDNTADRLITADMTIPVGCHLTIKQGTWILLKKYVNIYVEGKLTVEGTDSEPVIFTSEKWSEPWGGMEFKGAIGTFEYCMVSNGGGDMSKGYPTDDGWHTGHQHIFYGRNNSDFTFNQCFFLYSPGKVFGVQDGTVTVRNCVSSFVWLGGEFHRVFLKYTNSHIMNLPDDNNASYTEDIDTDGFHIDYVNPTYPQYSIIDSCYFITGKDDAIDHHASRLKISNCWLEDFVHEGVAASGRDTVKIFNTVALNNDQGFEDGWSDPGVNREPYVIIDHCIAVGNNVGLRIGDSYSWTYNNSMKVTNSIIYNNKDNILNYLNSTHAPLEGALEISYSMTNDPDYNASPYCITGVPSFDSYYYLLPGSPGINKGMRGTNMGRADSTALTVGSVIINEIMYNAPAGMNSKDWVELYNSQATAQDLSGWILKDDNDAHIFIIPSGTIIQANGYRVICEDTAEFKPIYPSITTISGNIPFGFGGKDQVRLFIPEGQIVDSVSYNNNSPWPGEADGDGYTIVLIDPAKDHTLPANWSRSGQYGGSPGRQNFIADSGGQQGSTPTQYILEQNYPNPFNSSTVFRFSLPQQSHIELEIFDILGRHAATIFSGQLLPGRYNLPWKPENLSSGVYLYRIRAGNFIAIKKLILLK
ncbi:MAG: lamin tail domain-containing protein [Bacteroidota bacterium]